LHFTVSDSIYSVKVMARCSPLNEVAAANIAEVETLEGVEGAAEVAHTVGDEIPVASGVGRTYDSRDGGASDNENSWTYHFGASTITLGRIKEMVERGYFAVGDARAPVAEVVPESDNVEVVVYEDFFVVGLRMPPHPVLADILLKFQAQLHQLTPNAIVQLSKYFWAAGSFGSVPSGDAFMK
jgi:hypothetical protein